MISSARHYLGWAAGCAALLIAGAWGTPASAQQDEACKSDVITATGRTKFRPFTKRREMEGRGSAMADAVANWQREAEAKFGDKWKRWSRATDTKFNCEPTSQGKIIGSSFIGCTISGRPCTSSLAAGGVVIEDDDDRALNKDGRDDDKGSRDRDRDRGRDRRRDRDRADRDDDRDDRARGSRGYDRRGAQRRYLAALRRSYGSPAYRRAMAYQDYLATSRRRAESRAYRRAMSRQDYLAAARDRAEGRGWARVEARHRYLGERRWRFERARYSWRHDY